MADNLSRIENIPHDPILVNDSFPNEQLAVLRVQSLSDPWYADYANFIVAKFFPPSFFSKGRKFAKT